MATRRVQASRVSVELIMMRRREPEIPAAVDAVELSFLLVAVISAESLERQLSFVRTSTISLLSLFLSLFGDS